MRKLSILQFAENSKILAVLTVAVFITVAFFGINSGMDVRQDGSMAGCVFDKSTVCLMSVIEHIAQWSNIFTATSEKNIFSIFTLGLLLLTAFFKRCAINLFNCVLPEFRIYRVKNNISKLFDYIIQAFSSGILNPKIYNSVLIIS